MKKYTNYLLLSFLTLVLSILVGAHIVAADTTSSNYNLGYDVACPSGTTYDANDNACHAPINCVVSDWGAWGAWTYDNGTACGTSGTRTHTHTRTVTTSPAYGGSACPALSEDASESYTTAACPVNGSCNAVHYACDVGSSVSNTTSGYNWTWACSGSNGGSSPSCSEGIPTVTSLSAQSVAYGGNPAISFTSANGYYCHVLMDGVWDWNVSGYFGSGTFYPGAQYSPGTHTAWVYCYNSNWTAPPSGWVTTPFTVGPAPINGSCNASHYSCNSGSSAYNGSNGSQWTWSCLGANGGSDASCSEYIPVNGSCNASHYSCNAGNTANNGNNGTQWTWDCNGLYGGSSTSCAEYIPVNGSCNAVHYACNSGSSVSNSQGTYNWTWACNGAYGGSSPSCSEGVPVVTSLSAQSVAYGGNPAISFTSANGYYCHVLMDGVWNWNVSGYFGSGTFYPGAQTSPGTHTAWVYCYNSNWSTPPSGWVTTPFTVYTPSGSLSPSSGSCTIPQNASSCTINLTWSTANSVYTSGFTQTGNSTPFLYSNSGSQGFTVPYGGITYYLYNSGYLLGQSTLSASCASGTTWNGSSCVAPSGAFDASSPSCQIGAYQSSCTIYYHWYVNYPISGSYVYDQSNNQVGSGNPGAGNFTIPYGTNTKTFYLKNNGSTLDTKTASASCISGYAWNGSSCVPPSTVNLTATPTKITYNTASTLSWTSTNASSCTLTGGGLNVGGTSGSVSTGNRTVATTYTVNCTGWAGNSSDSVTVYIIPTITFTSNPKLMISGRWAKLIWSATNATSCVGTNFSTGTGSPVSGYTYVKPTRTTTYTVTCTGYGGTSDSASLRANVTKVRFREL